MALSLRRPAGVSRNMKSKSSVVTGAPWMAAAALPISTASRWCSLSAPRIRPRSGVAFMTARIPDGVRHVRRQPMLNRTGLDGELSVRGFASGSDRLPDAHGQSVAGWHSLGELLNECRQITLFEMVRIGRSTRAAQGPRHQPVVAGPTLAEVPLTGLPCTLLSLRCWQ